MSLLFRYMVRGNVLLMLPTLGVGIGLYLLTDLFERLDNFIEAGVGVRMVLTYFAVKIPLVVSQILPVIFLLSTVIQLCLMARSRELVALQAGGVSLAVLGRMLLICGLFWGAAQLAFSEVLGVAGESESARIWQEEVRKRNLAATVLGNVWFTDGQWVVSLATLRPDGGGEGFTAYLLSPDNLNIERIVKAPAYKGAPGKWSLTDAEDYSPSAFSAAVHPHIELPLAQDPETFRLIKPGGKPQQLPLWQLGDAIDRLSASGSNVENLRTAWHMKVAYAASLVVMALLATALVSWSGNIYIATVLALLCTFLYYAVYTLGTSLGQRGIIPPPLAAWLADILFFALSCIRIGPMLWHRRSLV